jgi:hypothetical protein
MIYARSGSGNYYLKMNSYKCTNRDDTVIMASSSDVTLASASKDTDTMESEVSSPAADFISPEATG